MSYDRYLVINFILFQRLVVKGGALIERINQMLLALPEETTVPGEQAVLRLYEEEDPFKIENLDGIWVVSGKRIEKLLIMTNFNSDEGLSRFQKSIEKMGLEAALRERGIKEGDSVKILDLEFEYSE